MIKRTFNYVTAKSRDAIAKTGDLFANDESGHTARKSLKRWLWTATKFFALFVIVMGIGGLLLAASGIMPIKASSGHWAITRWFLQFSKQRSVATYSLGIEAPPLDEPQLVVKGAGAYETNCRGCHGSPALEKPRVAQAMTPTPPYLPNTLSGWEDGELFVIVKHGIKFTGMPAWPSQQRDDEVWAMVAFLRKFSELDAKGYQDLVNPQATLILEGSGIESLAPETTRPAIIANCVSCHGADGGGRGVFPKLAGQKSEYMILSLRAYAKSRRHSGVMEPLAVGLSDQQIRDLSLYYSRLQTVLASPPEPETLAAIQRGESIAQNGIPNQRVPPCIACHGPGDLPRNVAYPNLAGQYADYLKLQLELFNKELRGGSDYAHLMRRVAAGLTAEQMSDVAAYYSSLRPEVIAK